MQKRKPSDTFYLFYYTKSVSENLFPGKFASVSLRPSGEIGDKEGERRTAKTKDIMEIVSLYEGRSIVDCDKTNENTLVLKSEKDKARRLAWFYASADYKKWKESSYFQEPAPESVYRQYVLSFLTEFTRITRDLPPEKIVEAYPDAMAFPCEVNIYAGRDGVAFIFEPRVRPENINVKIDLSKILDELILPHPKGENYFTMGSSSQLSFICSDKNYIYYAGAEDLANSGNWAGRGSLICNPEFVILEKRYHLFWENIQFYRRYPSQKEVNRKIHFAEFFGDISAENFSEEKAKSRAKIYAETWAISNLVGSNIDSVSKFENILSGLKNVIDDPNSSEGDIEKCIDKNSWIIERGLGCNAYKTQVEIPKEILAYTNQSIVPDKFVERVDGWFDILDLKLPSMRLLVHQENRTRQSAEVSAVEAQLDNYLDLVRQPKAREFLLEKGIKISVPRLYCLGGRRPVEHASEWQKIKTRIKCDVVTYDDLLDSLNSILKWIKSIIEK